MELIGGGALWLSNSDKDSVIDCMLDCYWIKVPCAKAARDPIRLKNCIPHSGRSGNTIKQGNTLFRFFRMIPT